MEPPEERPAFRPLRLQDSGQYPSPDRGARSAAKQELGGQAGVGERGKRAMGDRRAEARPRGRAGVLGAQGWAQSGPRRPRQETADPGGGGRDRAGCAGRREHVVDLEPGLGHGVRGRDRG